MRWTPTGINVPDYPKLAQLWWQQIGDVNSGAFTPQQAMDRLAKRDGRGHGPHAGGRREAKVYGGCGPRLNPEKDPKRVARQAERRRKAKLENEKPQGETIDYDELIEAWRNGKVMPEGIKG